MMRKIYSSILSLNIALLVLLFTATKAKAQIDIPIGTGTVGNTTTGYPCPLQDFYEGSRMQYLYLASELTAAGMGPGNINSLKYNVVNLNAAGLIEQLTVKMGVTAAVSLGTATWETVGNALYGPVDYQPLAGINTLTFTTPFFWNGTDNLVIEICGGQPGNAVGIWFTENPTIPWTTGLAFNGSHNYRADDLDNLCGTATTTNTGTQTSRPNLTINWTPAAACTGVPNAGTAVANPSIVCLGIPFSLSVTGATVASGLTYQWQSSPNNVAFTDIAGATTVSLTTSQSVTTWYRLVVTCTAGGTSTSTSVQVTSPALVSGIFTINSALLTGGSNFQTFNDAYNYIKCGINGPVTFNVDPLSGPYTEQLIMIPVPGASATNTVTFNGSGRTIAFTSTNTNERAVIKLNGADHIKFNNLVINPTGTTTTEYGFGVHLTNDADSNAVTNCTININTSSTAVNYAGIVVSATGASATSTGNTLSDANIFRNNTINGGYYGITCVGSTTAAVGNNVIAGNQINDFYFYGIYILGNFNTQIDSNTISRPTRATVTTFNGIYMNSLSAFVQITRNTITNPFGGAPASTALFNGIFITGVDALSGAENKVINNRIYNVTGAGEANGINNTTSDNVLIQHNTILMDGTGGTAITRGFYQTTLAAGVRFENNIVAINRGGTGAKYATYHNTITSDIFSNNNVFFIYPAITNAFTGFYTTAQQSLVNWQAASGDDINSLSTNPVFTDIFTGNLRPTNASIDDQGAPLGILIDITGLPRSALSPDMGAYEFTPAPCTTPPVAGVTVVSPATVCVNTVVSIGLSGSVGGLGQTYQWQVSPTIGGPYTNIGNVLTNPDSTILSSVTQYYQVAVSCGAITTFSTPMLLTVDPALPQGTYTIDKTQLPSATNFISFNAAKDAMRCGIAGPIIFNVVAGTGPYNEQLILGHIANSSAFNTITFNGNGNTIAFSSNDNVERAVIKLRDADYFIFNDLTIDATGTGAYGFGVQLINNADTNIINNCRIICNSTATTVNFAGIVMNSSETAAVTAGNTLCDANIFSNNIITGGYYGITCVGSTTAAVGNNVIAGNQITDFYSFGIYILGNFNTRVDSNTISRPTRATVTTCNGIYMTGLSAFVQVTRNTITNPFGGAPASTTLFNGIFITGVDALGGAENKVINNRIYNVTGAGEANGINNTGSDNVWIQHNTILMDGAGGTAISRGFYQTTAAAGVRFENNIVAINRGGTGAKYATYHATIASDIYSNDNVFFIYPAVTNAFTGFYTTAQATLLNWQAASGDDANSLSTNPVFTDVLTGNLRPTNASIDNQGAPLGILIDITGLPRSALSPDMGAYEFTPAACTTPPVAGVTAIIPATVCVNTLVSIGLNSSVGGLNQTYQWQVSPTIGGPYTNIGNVLTNPDSTILSSVTQYYQVAVTCGGNTTFSTPMLLTVDPALPQGTYTIDKTQLPSATNFISFNAAKDAMRCGIGGPVIFNVVAGTGPYNEQLILGHIANSSAFNTITFNGNGNTIAFSSNDNAERAVIKLRDADYFTFNDLTIDAAGAGAYGFGVQLINNADTNIINNCRIICNSTATTVNFAGIVVSSSETVAVTAGNTFCDANTFSNNTISGGYYGITLVGSATAANAIKNNNIIANTIQDFYFYGIYTSGNAGAVIENNIINRPARTPVTTCYAIYSTGLSTGLRISKNRISNPFGGDPANTSVFAGVYITATDGGTAGLENIVSNNLIYNVNGAGIHYGLYNNGSNNTKYYHNTISMQDNTPSVATAATYGFYQTVDADGIDIRNNMITLSRGNSGNKFGLYFATATTVYTSNNNNLYLTGPNTFTGFNGINRITLLDWQTATGQDANSVALNPYYISPATGNFAPASPAVDNLGTPVGITTDILDNPRSATIPDIGAWEFAIPPCSAPPLAGAATANPSSGFCLGTPIDLSLLGYVFGSGQTYQWEYSTSATGPWLPLGGPRIAPDTTILASGTYYYHVVVSCGIGSTTSGNVFVNMNPAFVGGYYTINPATPPFYPTPGSTNFESFTTAVAALECGITDFVTFDVAPGVYDEQIRMHDIYGTGPTKRITFRGAAGNPGAVTLVYDATVAANNYTLKLDSAKYVTYRDMTITAANDVNGRAVQLANTASYDSILNCNVNVAPSNLTTNTIVGIFADGLRGSHNVIKGNSITNGSSGIYFAGAALPNLAYDNVIDSNLINSSFFNGIYIGLNGRVTVSKNQVFLSMPRSATSYGIYSLNSDSAYQYVGNNVSIDGMTTTNTYGMYFTGCDGKLGARGRIAGNTILGVSGNTGNLYGLYQTASTYNNTVNNVISINTSGATSYGSYYTGGGGVNFHNNTVVSTATSATNNVAAYFAQTTGISVNIQNNIFSHEGGGRAMFVTNLNFIYSNYNTFYTTGASLIQNNAANNYATLPAWMNAVNWDLNSIAVQPAFLSTSDPRPDLSSPEVWAIHGRGTQIPGNDYDFNNNPRPTTFTTGVPDMGAYEFLPTSVPTVLTAFPAVPAPGLTQVFMYATDTVARITYDATAPVPSSINVRRYSGVLPTGLSAGQQSMYFYTDFDVPAQGAYKYKIEQFYIDPWRGFVPTEPQIRMGRTDATNTWVVGPGSSTEIYSNIIQDTDLVHIDRFTGLTGDASTAPAYTTVIDTSNRGTRFWVPYGNHYSMSIGANGQDMWLYLSAEDSANVTVRVNGTSWKRTYAIPANTARVSDIMPKSGLIDARILTEGLNERGISITSDVPIVAYAHIYDGATSGASLLLPVGVYGYDYQSLNSKQYYCNTCYSWTSVITDRDSTLVEITPSVTTLGGHPAGVPFTVMLKKGEVYTIMGTTNGSAGTDLSGTRIRSVPNSSGNCYPMAVFSGSTRTAICYFSNGDNMIQQVFPAQAWGKKYLTFATANSASNTTYYSNLFRVMVKDPTTVVSKNGTVIPQASLVVPGNYYEFSTTAGAGPNGAIYVEADKPVMMAQYMVSTSADECPGVNPPGGNGDPEMMYISPIEQGIKKAVFYNTNESAITANYVNIVVPTAALPSLTIDGATAFTDVFTHPGLAGYTCIRQNLGNAAGQHTVRCDSAFTAITYGLGSVESYGYNAGTLVKNLNALPTIVVNTLGSGIPTSYTCVDAPFNFAIYLTSETPQALTWLFSQVSNLTPNADVTQLNPVYNGTIVVNGRTFYKYEVPINYVFSASGVYNIKILVKDSLTIDGCDNTQEVSFPITVIEAPIADFTSIFSGCIGAPVILNGTGTTANGVGINTWTWNFGDLTPTATGQSVTHTYLAPGTYNINLNMVALDGCVGDTTKPITVNALPPVEVINDSLVVCGNDPVTFEVLNPDPGSTYDWYTTLTGGTSVFTGPVYTVPSVTGTIEFYVQATNAAGCISERKRVKASILPDLAIPVATVDSVGADMIRFKWDPVPNALTYEVSIDNGTTWTVPSSGATGLTHTVTGLLPLTDVTLIVRATGASSCQTSVSAPVTGKTLSANIYIPNAFTPNGDGLNDILLVYGQVIKDLKFTVFNQWGEKIFESSNQATGWNGTYKGKAQPSGVYMYVCQITLKDGTTQTKKGSINLVR